MNFFHHDDIETTNNKADDTEMPASSFQVNWFISTYKAVLLNPRL